MTNVRSESRRRLVTHDVCLNQAGQLIVGLALGRTAGTVRVRRSDSVIEWDPLLYRLSPGAFVRPRWNAFCITVAGMMAEFLAREIGQAGRALAPNERADALRASAPKRSDVPLPFGPELRGVSPGGDAGEDPESALLWYAPLASAIIWREDFGFDDPKGDVSVVKAEAADLLLFSPSILTAAGVGPLEGWLCSPYGPLVDLIRRAEATAERILLGNWSEVRAAADALYRNKTHRLSRAQIEAISVADPG